MMHILAVPFAAGNLAAAALEMGAWRSGGSGTGIDLLSLCLAPNAAVRPQELWTAWSFAPAVTLPLVLAATVYAVRLARAYAAGDRRLLPGRALMFVGGLLLLTAALVSPLCRLAANLASAHMVQHVILVALAPPLLVLGWLGPPRPQDTRLLHSRVLGHPFACAGLYGALIWLWHFPRLYEAALLGTAAHLLMYASLIGVSLLFWRSIVGAARSPVADRAFAIPALLATMLHTGLLGALLTFSPSIWFPLMAPGAVRWGLTPLEDQQLAGLIMWVPMAAAYLVAALWLIGKALASRTAEAPALFVSSGSIRTRAPLSDYQTRNRV